MFENAIKNRYEFVMLYDVTNGNPNGDPDAGNMPRIDPETGHGIVTDVCIKRKIRNYVDEIKNGEPGFGIYIKQDRLLNEKDNEAVDSVKKIKDQDEKDKSFQSFMCSHYYDIRTFGAVMTTAGRKGEDVKLRNTAGQVRGPVQFGFGQSIDIITPQEITITRMAVTSAKDSAKSNTMGYKYIVPYGLYKQEGFISANLAGRVTGFSDADLELLWEAINNMFEFDRSAARGVMALRGLYVFRHDSAFGNAPAHKLFELVKVTRKDGVAVPRSFDDYTVTIGEVPEGVSIENKAL
jgi:CRISPR-associated protein Csd2